MGNTVGIFGNVNHVETAIKQLIDAGLESDAISLLATGIAGNQTVHGVVAAHGDTAKTAIDGKVTAEAGIFKLLSGFALIWLPGTGPALAVGPVAEGLAGAMTGAGQRALTTALAALGIPDNFGDAYTDLARSGSYVVVVATDAVEASGVARQLLDDNGASQVDVHATL